MAKPQLVVFASGTKEGGGSGFENLVNARATGVLDADIVAVVSDHEQGGVHSRAQNLGIPFRYFPGPFDADAYRNIVRASGADWVALSGWLKLVHGLDPARTFNIHPAPLSFDNGRFGGSGMYGHHAHETVKAAFDAGEVSASGFSMHFVTNEYDRGPVFFEHPVPLRSGMSAEDIAAAVNRVEHEWQPKITNMVVHREIRWDGSDPASLVVPPDFA